MLWSYCSGQLNSLFKIKDDEDVIEANKDLMKICSITDYGHKLNLNKL